MGLAPFSPAGPRQTKTACEGRGCASEFLSALRELLYTQQALTTGINGSKRSYGSYFISVFSSFPPPSLLSTKWCTLPLRLKWWLVTIWTPLPVGRGAGPQPAHAGSGLRFQDGDSLCNWRDRRWVRESRSRFSPGSRGRGSDLERGLCPAHTGAPPLPRPPDRLPHSFSPTGCHLRPLLVSCLGVSASGHPSPGVLQCWSLIQDPYGPLAFPAVGAPISLLGSSALGAPALSIPSNSGSPLFPSPISQCTCCLLYRSPV